MGGVLLLLGRQPCNIDVLDATKYRALSMNATDSSVFSCGNVPLHDQKVNLDREISLSDMSPKDDKWTVNVFNTRELAHFLIKSGLFEKWGYRMLECAVYLFFAPIINFETGEYVLKLMTANLCHCRHCFVCGWRRQLKHMAIFLKSLPKILEDYPKSRWVFMTLTVPNVPIDSLRDEIKLMSKGWKKLIERKEFRNVEGWIRKVEVTCDKKRNDYAHPHFHCLLMVKPSWFKGSCYIKQSRWAEIWGECMKLDVTPIVDIRAVKGTPDKAAIEVLKAFNYSIKPEVLVKNSDWLLEYFKQVHHLRFLSAGGALKHVLKNTVEETDDDLIHINDSLSEDETKARLCFKYLEQVKKHMRFYKCDRGIDS